MQEKAHKYLLFRKFIQNFVDKKNLPNFAVSFYLIIDKIG